MHRTITSMCVCVCGALTSTPHGCRHAVQVCQGCAPLHFPTGGASPVVPPPDWIQVVSQDVRPEVRNSGVRTLFAVVVNQGPRLSHALWEQCLWEMLFPLLNHAYLMSATASRDEVGDMFRTGLLSMAGLGVRAVWAASRVGEHRPWPSGLVPDPARLGGGSAMDEQAAQCQWQCPPLCIEMHAAPVFPTHLSDMPSTHTCTCSNAWARTHAHERGASNRT